MSAEDKILESRGINKNLSELLAVIKPRMLLLYKALPDEAVVGPFAEYRCAYPVIEEDMFFALPSAAGAFHSGAYGILEPDGERLELFGEDSVCITPGRAFGRAGERLGRGKGYYDSFFAGFPGIRIGVCFGCQLFSAVPHDKNDIAMHYIVTPYEIINVMGDSK